MAVTANSESSANDLMEVILPDQSMCSAILKVANSAFFGVPRGVSTVERAVVVLGFEEIKNIIIGKAIFASFPQINKENRHTISLFWEHAFTCGLAAKVIAEGLHLSPSEFFIAGLIHDIGKLAMLMTFPHDYSILGEISNLSHFSITTEEQASFSISHDKVGLQLGHRWLLPEQLVMAMGYHHMPEKAPSHRPYPLIIQMADLLSLMYCTQEKLKSEDIAKIFDDFLPETSALWQKNGLKWDTSNLGIWFETLKQSCEADQGILTVFTS
jgi:HD-like signal output (HDOD) protein